MEYEDYRKYIYLLWHYLKKQAKTLIIQMIIVIFQCFFNKDPEVVMKSFHAGNYVSQGAGRGETLQCIMYDVGCPRSMDEGRSHCHAEIAERRI